MTHLRYDCIGAAIAGVTQHPQRVMRDLGITYAHATPQSMADQWWFWACEGMPDPLPGYLEVANWNPLDMIGFGLSRETALRLASLEQTGTGDRFLRNSGGRIGGRPTKTGGGRG